MGGPTRRTRAGRVAVTAVAVLVGLLGTAVAAAPAVAHTGPAHTGPAVAPAGPVLAHGADAPAGTDYRATVTGLRPDVPGLRVRLIEAGARLELTNHTGRTVEVLGYAGEPYLEIRPDGVYENLNSPDTYTNRTLAGDTAVPAGADPTSPPRWHKTDDGSVARWHDRRARWTGEGVPEPVRADPERPHRVADWTVPLRVGARDVELRGTLDWLPPPSPGRWWLAGLIGTLLVGTLGLAGTLGGSVGPVRGQPPRPASAGPAGPAGPAGRAAVAARHAVAGLCVAAGLGAIALATARVGDGTATGLTGTITGLFTGPRWATLSGLGALAAGGYALIRRSSADFAVALTGVCVGTFGGVANGAAFSNSVVPATWPPSAYRWLVLATIVLGYGVAVAGVLRLRAARLAATAPDVGAAPDDRQRAADGRPGPAPATRGSKP